jgi:hypothetical protein
MIPPAALRYDPGVLVTAFGRYAGDILTAGPIAASLTKPFSKAGGCG